MASEKSKSKDKDRSKSDKKSKSSSTHGEKKRKRDHEQNDEPSSKSKSKKHKSDKHTSHHLSTTSTSRTSTTTNALATANDLSNSPFHLQTTSLYLPLAPVSQKYPLEGLCAEHLSPLILTYYPPLRGVILSYSNVRLSEVPLTTTSKHTHHHHHTSSSHADNETAEGNGAAEPLLMKSIDEYAPTYTWLTADFVLFKPTRGVILTGYVNLQNEGHLGVVCWNLFNASISRDRLPRDWVWKDVSSHDDEDEDMDEDDGSEKENGNGNGGYAPDGQGHYVDSTGHRIPSTITFKVKEIESSHDRERGFLSIEGTMLEDDEERELVLSERSASGKGKETAGRRLGGERGFGATSLGIVAEDSQESVKDGGKKHRVRY